MLSYWIGSVRRSGLCGRFRVVSNGSDAPGTWIEDCSPEFAALLDRVDLVVAKGQGNFETLSRWRGNVFFLLMAKCPPVARELGVAVGSYVLREGRAGR